MAAISSGLHRQAGWKARLSLERCLPSNIPDKPYEFPGDGREDAGLRFAGPAQSTIPRAEPGLRFPADVFDMLRQMC